MRKTKHTLTVIGVIVAIVLVGGWVFAHGPGGKRGYGETGCCGGSYSNLSPEQKEKLQAQQKKFYEDTAELRRELSQKRLELRSLWVDPKADPKKIRAKQKELFELQRRLQEKALEHKLAIRELFPEEQIGQGPWGSGYGMGQGPHHGKGHKWGPGQGSRRGSGGGPRW